MRHFILLIILWFCFLSSCVQVPSHDSTISPPVEPTIDEKPRLTINPNGHSDSITDVMFTSDGKRLISVSKDKTILIWDTESGELLDRTIRGQIGDGLEGMFYAGALSPDDNILAVGGILDKPVSHFGSDYSTDLSLARSFKNLRHEEIADDILKKLQKLEDQTFSTEDEFLRAVEQRIGKDQTDIYKAVLLKHARDYSTNIGQIRLFNLRGKQIGLLQGHTSKVLDLAFSADSQWLASSSGNAENAIRIWDVSGAGTGQRIPSDPIATLQGHWKDVAQIAFSPDRTKLVSASFDGTLRLWELSHDSKQSHIIEENNFGFRCVAYAPDGNYIVSGRVAGGITLWDDNGNFLKEIASQEAGTIVFSADSDKIVVTSGDSNSIAVYSIPAGEQLSQFSNHTSMVTAAAFSPNNLIASAGGDNHDIYIWDADSGTEKLHRVGMGRTVWSVAFGDGLQLAFGNSQQPSEDTNCLVLEKSFDFSGMNINLASPIEQEFRPCVRLEYAGKLLKKISQSELQIINGGEIIGDIFYSYTFTTKGDVIIGGDASLKLYQDDGKLLHSFIGHTGKVLAVSVSRDGRILASAGSDQTIRLWNLKTYEAIAALFVASDDDWICWTPNGYYASSPEGEKYIGWHNNQGADKEAEYYSVDSFPSKYNRTLVTRTIAWGDFEKALKEVNPTPLSPSQKGEIQKPPPRIKWLEPEENPTEVYKSSLPITVKVSSDPGSEITKVIIRQNGSTVATISDLPPSRFREPRWQKTIEREISLSPGENVITIYVEDNNELRNTAHRKVQYHAPGEERWKSTLYMVSIGISEYKIKEKRLNYARADAEAISELFREQEGKLYRRVIIKPVYDKDATRDNIIRALQWLRREVTQPDTAIVFIAAHGYNEENQYFLLPFDGNPDELRITGIDWRDFVEILGDLPSRLLLFLDTCHSGKLGEDIDSFRGEVDITEAINELATDEYGVVIVAASRDKEVVKEYPELGHGAFTKVLLDGLRGQADQDKNNIIDLNELISDIQERVKQLTNGAQHPTRKIPTTIYSSFPILQVK